MMRKIDDFLNGVIGAVEDAVDEYTTTFICAFLLTMIIGGVVLVSIT